MRLINKLKQLSGKRKQPKLEAAPSPSKIWEAAGSLDRAARRQDKLDLRRAYRSPACPRRGGVMSSVDRQNLAKISLAHASAEMERQAEEDKLYAGVA